MRDPAEQYLFNVGTLQAGEWISNAPSVATLGVRVGYPTRLSPAEAQEHVRATVAAADPGAELRFVGFRAEGYRIPDDDPFAVAVARAHRLAHAAGDDGTRPARRRTTRASTRAGASRRSVTARHGRNLHAVDEAVEVASIVAGARTLTRLIPHWLHGDDDVTDISLGGAASGSSALAPVHLRNAGEHVADRLVTAIALGEYITGQRLPSERELAALLAVNRASVREALHRLAEAGYVEIRRGRHGGAFVQAVVGPRVARRACSARSRPTGRRSRSSSTCAA